MEKIAVIGIGYVGLPLALEFGKHRPVVGFDIDTKRVAELQRNVDKTKECSEEQMRASKFLTFSSSKDDLSECQIYIITVPTPVTLDKRPDLSSLIYAAKMVSDQLEKGDLVIFESTVYPGATEDICVPVLEKSGLIYNKDFFVGYSPERINPGDKINTIAKIKKITSGSNDYSAQKVDALYREIITAGTWLATSIKVAEAAKVIENSQRDLNIAFVNELSKIFAKLDIDTIEVLEAAGSKWNFIPFRPGLVGGHCIGVDPYYLTHKAEELHYRPEVILAGRRINDGMSAYSAQQIIKMMNQNGHHISSSKVGVLGITFKENCPDMRNSKIIDLVNELVQWGCEIFISDCWACEQELFDMYQLKLTKIENMRELDALIVAVGHNEYRNLDIKELASHCRFKNKPVLADLKSLYSKAEAQNHGFSVFRL